MERRFIEVLGILSVIFLGFLAVTFVFAFVVYVPDVQHTVTTSCNVTSCISIESDRFFQITYALEYSPIRKQETKRVEGEDWCETHRSVTCFFDSRYIQNTLTSEKPTFAGDIFMIVIFGVLSIVIAMLFSYVFVMMRRARAQSNK